MTQDCQKVKESPFAAYHARAGDGPPRTTLTAALDAFADEPPQAGRLAVDLGCGTGRDTMALLACGWRVLAIDRDAGALATLRARAAAADLPAPLCLAADLATVVLPPCDLVNAGFCLFLCPPGAFDGLWQRIAAALRPGGRFSGQLLGPCDGWADRQGITVHDRHALGRLLAGLEIEKLEEEQSDTVTPRGRHKHWHLWHVVARRPAAADDTLSESRS